jgi:hypothetical protein
MFAVSLVLICKICELAGVSIRKKWLKEFRVFCLNERGTKDGLNPRCLGTRKNRPDPMDVADFDGSTE